MKISVQVNILRGRGAKDTYQSPSLNRKLRLLLLLKDVSSEIRQFLVPFISNRNQLTKKSLPNLFPFLLPFSLSETLHFQ